jgi:hypothetical protein
MEITKIRVKLSGLSEIMVDKFIDHSRERRPPEQKLYLGEGNTLVLPQDNIDAFMFGDDPPGCARTFEGKAGKQYMRMGAAHVFITEAVIPFTANGKPVIFTGFEDGKLWIHKGSPRVKQGSRSIKQEMKERPVLKRPWEIEFNMTVIKNTLIDENKLHNWFEVGGMQIALGTYRPKFGRFEVVEWEVIE